MAYITCKPFVLLFILMLFPMKQNLRILVIQKPHLLGELKTFTPSFLFKLYDL